MTGESRHRYLIALGSNQRHPRLGAPRAVIETALAALELEGWTIESASPVLANRPIGPSLRCYANAAAVIASELAPPEALASLQSIERMFGRTRRGARWRARVLDLDIVLWSGGAWMSDGLTIPHPLFRERRFVLDPAAAAAPHWRDPMTRLTLRQLARRPTRSRFPRR